MLFRSLFSSKYVFANEKILKEDLNENIYMQAFLKNISLRSSCYDCKANNFKSGSDITLGDFWGIENIHPRFDDNKGSSLVILNTKKGMKVFENIRNRTDYIKTDIEQACKYNMCLTKSVRPHVNREEFFNNLDSKEIITLIEEEL